MMYRVLTIVGGALMLAACSSSPDWMSLDGLKPAPAMDTVRFESEPPNAEVKAAGGQTCRTPCALALPVSGPTTVTFTLAGYQPETETLEPITAIGSPTNLRPNPVTVELTPAAPAPKPTKKSASRKTSATPAAPKSAAPKSAAKPKPPAAAAPAPAPAADPGAAPWPAPAR
jgi:hypothetical protein